MVALIASVALGSSSSFAASAGSTSVGWDVPAGLSRWAAGAGSGLPISRRPSGGLGDPQGDGYSVPSKHVCGPHICVHWVSSTADAPPAIDGNHNLVPDQVDRTLTAFDAAWTAEVGRMGFRAPKSDATSRDHGPDGRLDVYLADVGARNLGGYVATDDPHASDNTYLFRDYSAYVVMDNDFSTAQLGSSGGLGGLRVTAAHEFFHTVQYAYDSGEDDWLVEGTAVWMEDQVADDVNANRIWLRESPLMHPWIPVDSSQNLNEYGAWIFWQFLAESDGAGGSDPSIVRRVWELAADAPGDPNLFSARAVSEALSARHRSLASVLDVFGVWNLAPAVFYEEGAAYPKAPIVRHHRVSVRHPIAGRSTLSLNHLSTGAVSFEPGSGSPARASLRLELDAPATQTGSAARVVLFFRSGFLRVIPVALDEHGDADLRVPFGASQVRRVVLVYANASTSFRCWMGGGYSCNGLSRADRLPFSYLAALVR
ncbi:MAG: MXAN_6640 family putative metalloprotease [Actinomycetota bacterium]